MSDPKKKINECLIEAKAIAQKAYRSGCKSFQKPDGTYGTQVEIEIERMIRKGVEIYVAKYLHTSVRIFGEEEGWSGSEGGGCTAVIDPIDGTLLFLSQIPTWGMALYIHSRESESEMAWFLMPETQKMFYAERGSGATLNGEKLLLKYEPINENSYLAVSSDASRWNLASYPGKIRAFGSSGFHLVSAATNIVQAAFLTRFKFHDILSPGLIHEEAGGGLAYYPSGRPVKLSGLLGPNSKNGEQYIIASHPRNIARMLGMEFHKQPYRHTELV